MVCTDVSLKSLIDVYDKSTQSTHTCVQCNKLQNSKGTNVSKYLKITYSQNRKKEVSYIRLNVFTWQQFAYKKNILLCAVLMQKNCWIF